MVAAHPVSNAHSLCDLGQAVSPLWPQWLPAKSGNNSIYLRVLGKVKLVITRKVCSAHRKFSVRCSFFLWLSRHGGDWGLDPPRSRPGSSSKAKAVLGAETRPPDSGPSYLVRWGFMIPLAGEGRRPHQPGTQMGSEARRSWGWPPPMKVCVCVCVSV